MNRNRKIVMISPPAIALANQIRKTIPPFGLLTVGATVEERGYDDLLLIDSVVEGFDNVVPDTYDGFIKYGLDDGEIARRVEEFGAEFVGISVLFSGMAECGYNVARAIKKRLPDIPICMGGIHITAVNKKKLMTEQKSIDYVLDGEGDLTFPDLLDTHFGNKKFEYVSGLTWKIENEVIENRRSKLIEDLDTLPFPAWHKFDMEKYYDINIPFSPFVSSPRVGTIITSRGCPANCNFCFISWTAAKDRGDNKPYRTLSADYTVRMIDYLIENWGIKELQILDDSFTVDYHRCMEIFERIKDYGLRIEFPNGIRADLPKDLQRRKNLYKAMKDAGVWQVCFSPEHGNQEYLLDYIDKGMDLSQVISSCDIAHDNGFLVHSNFIMGFPGETKELRNDTEQYARKLDADSFSFSFATPYPGTALYEEVKQKSLFVSDYDENRVMFDKVNIIPHDISEQGLFSHVENLNREINELAQVKRPELTKLKYQLLDTKIETKDKKYHHIKEKDNYLPTTANYMKERIAGV
jgi:anaerobic magnesium-protoporphyrin IX monomethyl ester cyclase|tara:strand:- start:421 stop:1989 length:1569 start_codon:yes stop_codon:yes gene_type:complete